MKRSPLVLASALLLTVSAVSVNAQSAPPTAPPPPAAPEKGEHHPHLRMAIHELECTIKQLKEAPHDFGGHREAAIKASEEALIQLREALKFVHENKPHPKAN